MKVRINCGACPEAHRADDVEYIILVRRSKNVLTCEVYGEGKLHEGQFLAIVPDWDNGMNIFNSKGWTVDEALKHIAEHRAKATGG